MSNVPKTHSPISNPMSPSTIELHVGPQSPITTMTGLDRYGFSHILSGHLGLQRPLRPFCHWVHGWAWWEDVVQPEDLLGPRPLPQTTSIIVGSPLQMEILANHGYRNVHVGGLPFAYVNPQGVHRNGDALLAFIGHSAEIERMDVADARYLDYLESIRRSFDEVYVSIFSLDHNEMLVGEIRRRGLTPFLGANPTDKHSMLRTRRALEYCEHVSTNTFGSHIAYALSAGCKVSVFSPTYRYDVRRYLNTAHGYHPSYADRMRLIYSEEYLRRNFAMVFDRRSRDGLVNVELGQHFIGHAHKLPTDRLRAAVGWTITDQIKGYARGGFRRMGRMVAASLPALRTRRLQNLQ